MKPIAAETITRIGDLDGRKVAMGFDQNSLAHLYSILVDLYSDPELACIREYATNAYDSHVEAGVNRPIEVTTPTSFSPYFKVRDYGVGMDGNTIENVYSKFGASTKRESDAFNGMLGVGCKAGLTYTAQFVVTAVKEGIKTQVAVSRNTDGSGVMEIIDESITTEHNGVEISIPVKRNHMFLEKATKFFSFWKPGTVLLNGQAPEPLNATNVTDNLLVVKDLGSDFVVMGNVAYPVKGGLNTDRSYTCKFGVVAFVPIGSVAFAPSREELLYNGTTEAAIHRLRMEFKQNLTKAIEDDIASAENHSSAVLKLLFWRSQFYSLGGVKYKGETIQWTYRGIDKAWYYRPDYGRGNTTRPTDFDYNTFAESVVITGFEPENFASHHKAKIKLWLNAAGLPSRSRIVLLGEMVGAPWTDAIATYKWSDVKTTKVPRNANGPVAVSYQVVNEHGYRTHTDKIDATKPIYYLSRKESPSSFKALTALVGDATIVVLPPNRWDKFVKAFPTAKHIDKFLSEAYDKAKNALTEEDKIAIAADWHTQQLARILDPEKIDDPFVKTAIATVRSVDVSDELKTYNKVVKVYHSFEKSVIGFTPVNIVERYPLLYNCESKNVGHAYAYINAVYKNNQESK